MTERDDVVILDAVRTPIGRRNGALSAAVAPEMLADVLSSLVGRTGIDPAVIGHVIGGCVTQVGAQSSNVTRNAWLMAGLPLEVPAVTVTAQCGSSQEATLLGHGLAAAGLVDVAVACGVETMTRIPPHANVPEEPDFGQPRRGHFTDFYELTTQFEAAGGSPSRGGSAVRTWTATANGHRTSLSRRGKRGVSPARLSR